MPKKKTTKNNVFFPPWEKVIPDEDIKIPKEEILSTKYDKKKIEEFGEIDVLIIGSGIGGLASGVFCSKLGGKKTVILEQFYQGGGSCVSFGHNGYEFETGLNYVDDCGEKSLNNIIFKYLSEGEIEWLRYGDVMDTLYFPKDEKNEESKERIIKFQAEKLFIDHLKKEFPHESKNLDNFFKLCKKIFGETFGIVGLQQVPLFTRFAFKKIWAVKWQKYLNVTINECLDEFFEDKDLKKIFTTYSMLMGYNEDVPAGSVLFVLYAYMRNSAFFPKGGSSIIPKLFGKVFYKNGGRMFTNAKVKKILVTKKKVNGVQLENGDIIKAKHVISGCGMHNTYKYLEEKFRPKMYKDLKRSVTNFFVFVGIDADLEEVDFPSGNVFLVNDVRKEKEFCSQKLEDLMKKDKFTPPCVFISNHNHIWKPEKGKSSFVITVVCAYEWFEQWKTLKVRNRGNEYEEIKDWFTEKIMEIVYKRFPKIEERVQCCFSASPLSVEHFLNYEKGEIYGIRQNSDRYLKVYDEFCKKNPIKNLHFCGADFFFSHGITPALYSSMFACEKILKKNIFGDAEKAQKIINKKDTI